jgi:unconventional prefoldin RPB5 interactor 1
MPERDKPAEEEEMRGRQGQAGSDDGGSGNKDDREKKELVAQKLNELRELLRQLSSATSLEDKKALQSRIEGVGSEIEQLTQDSSIVATVESAKSSAAKAIENAIQAEANQQSAADIEARRNELSNRIAEIDKRLDQLSKRSKEIEKELGDIAKQRAQNKREQEDLRKQLERETDPEKRKELEKTLEEKRRYQEYLDRKEMILSKEQERISRETDRLHQQKGGVQREMERWQKEKGELQKEKEGLQKEKEGLGKEKVTLNIHEREYEKQLKAARDKNSILEAEIMRKATTIAAHAEEHTDIVKKDIKLTEHVKAKVDTVSMDRAKVEADRVKAEADRVKAEADRVKAEADKVKLEASRAKLEELKREMFHAPGATKNINSFDISNLDKSPVVVDPAAKVGAQEQLNATTEEYKQHESEVQKPKRKVRTQTGTAEGLLGAGAPTLSETDKSATEFINYEQQQSKLQPVVQQQKASDTQALHKPEQAPQTSSKRKVRTGVGDASGLLGKNPEAYVIKPGEYPVPPHTPTVQTSRSQDRGNFSSDGPGGRQ